jgi:hypothetical protein
VESAEECTDRWLRFFGDLKALEYAPIGNWGPPADTHEEALQDLPLEYDSLRSHVHQSDDRFWLRCWNRRDGAQGVGFTGWCGAPDTRFLLNQAHLDMHTESDQEIREWGRVAAEVMTSLVRAWEPDWGFFVNDQLRTRQYEQKGRPQQSPIAGYLTYLSSARCAALPSRVPAQVTGTPDGGVLLSLIEADGSMRKPNEVLRLASVLSTSGAFLPTPHDRPTLGSERPAGPATQGLASAMRETQPEVIRLRLKYEPTPEYAAAFAADIVQATLKITGEELDYSRASLSRVDAVIEDLRSDGPSVDQVRETLFGFGCYVGEVMVRNAGGWWDVPQSREEENYLGWPLLVRFAGGRTANPIHKVMRRYADGEQHDLRFFYDVFAPHQPSGT